MFKHGGMSSTQITLGNRVKPDDSDDKIGGHGVGNVTPCASIADPMTSRLGSVQLAFHAQVVLQITTPN